ncbi:hypothetical protein GCM10017744_001310 [Streptomyces antimycoticus]
MRSISRCRRRVYGYAGAVLGSSLALGPLVAQALLAAGGWPLVFVAPGAVATVAALATLTLPGLRSSAVSENFDRAGAVLFGVTVAAAVTALGLGFGTGVPWWVPVALVLVAAASAIGLVRVERRASDPAIPVDLLRIPAYRAYTLATGAFMGMLVVGLTVLPQLGSAQGMGAGGAAVMLSLLTVPSTLLPLLAARIARRWARPLVTTALFTCAVTAVILQATNHPAALLLAAAVIGLCLGLVSYADMAVRARPASTTPEETLRKLTARLHIRIPGTGERLGNRIAGLAPMTGFAAGLGMRAVLGVARAAGWRPSLRRQYVVATVGALIGTNGPMTVLGVTDPRTWGLAGWVSDIVPHIAYAVVTVHVLDGLQ